MRKIDVWEKFNKAQLEAVKDSLLSGDEDLNVIVKALVNDTFDIDDLADLIINDYFVEWYTSYDVLKLAMLRDLEVMLRMTESIH